MGDNKTETFSRREMECLQNLGKRICDSLDKSGAEPAMACMACYYVISSIFLKNHCTHDQFEGFIERMQQFTAEIWPLG